MDGLKCEFKVVGAVQTNCYFVYNTATSECIIIDPGDEEQAISIFISQKGFKPVAILLTHGHFDHIWGSRKLRELSGAKIYACEEEKSVCEDAVNNVSEQAGRAYTVKPNHYLKDGEEITIAGMTCKLIATPGHTIGSCCYYFEEDGILISGDTLFQESVGRTDFPTGSMGSLVRSIKEKLFVLPDETKVYPGHGDMTDIGSEKKYNPFLQ